MLKGVLIVSFFVCVGLIIAGIQRHLRIKKEFKKFGKDFKIDTSKWDI